MNKDKITYINYSDLEKYKYYKAKFINLNKYIDLVTSYISYKGLTDELHQYIENSTTTEQDPFKGGKIRLQEQKDIPVID